MTQPTPEEFRSIIGPYERLYTSIELRTSPEMPLLLAHYTSVTVVEQILRNDEVWFANPLYMNDLDEMRAGVLTRYRDLPRVRQAGGGNRSSRPPSARCLQSLLRAPFERTRARYVCVLPL